MNYYLAGPMRGHPWYNFPAFEHACTALRDRGYNVTSPHELDIAAGFNVWDLSSDTDWNQIPPGFDFDACIRRDLEAVRQAEGVICLPGWRTSRGAVAEVAVALWGRKRVLEITSLEPLGLIDATLETGDVARDTGTGETRITDPTTGGQKGSKLARFDLIPAPTLYTFAEIFGVGAKKYADRNWERGYRWSLSFAALQRHAWLFWHGEDTDKETGLPHILHAAWHCFVLATFMRTHRGGDDRPQSHTLSTAPAAAPSSV